jgi:ribonuclease HI
LGSTAREEWGEEAMGRRNPFPGTTPTRRPRTEGLAPRGRKIELPSPSSRETQMGPTARDVRGNETEGRWAPSDGMATYPGETSPPSRSPSPEGLVTMGLEGRREGSGASNGMSLSSPRCLVDGREEKPIRVFQINLHHSKAASHYLTKVVEKEEAVIVLVQEPWTIANRICGKVPKAELHVGATKQERPRACIYTKGVDTWKLAMFSDKDMVTLRIQGIQGMGETVVSSTYMAAESPAPPEMVRRLTEYCQAKSLPLIIGTDCNSHHVTWGSSDTNSRGELLFEFLMESSLVCANVGSEPTFVTSSRSEVLDITMVNQKAQGLVKDWRVDKTPSLSDHRYICFSLTAVRRIKRYFRPVKNTSWNCYLEEVTKTSEELPEVVSLSTDGDIEMEARAVEGLLLAAFHKACPEKMVSAKADNQWWNSRLEDLKKRVRRSLDKARKTKRKVDWDVHRDIQRVYTSAIQRAKKDSWRRFTESIQQVHPLARVVKLLKRDTSVKLGAVKCGERLTESPRETLEVMMEHHVPGAMDVNHSLPGEAEHTNQGVGMTEEIADGILQGSSMERAIMAFAPYKSPGPDGLYPVLLQKAWYTSIGERYRRLFKASLVTGYIPESWRRGRGVFIPKPGKGSYEDVKAFRMITLTSFQLKWLERLILWHLEKDRRVQERLNPRQFGFRAGVSTETALHLLVRKIEKAMYQGEYALGIFLDIQNAFPTVATESIKVALNRLQVDVGTQSWITGSLAGRTIEVSIGDTSIVKRATRGCPQGGILSPFLWNAVLDEFLELSRGLGYYAQAYADDIVGLFIGKDPPTLVDLANGFMSRATSWGEQNGLKFSQAKTEAVVFTRKRSWKARKPLHMGGVDIALSSETKFLGVILDQKLLFHGHVKERVKKAKMVLAQVSRLIGKTWGTSPAMARWAYLTMVRPVITYAAVVWIKAAENLDSVTRLRKVQRAACMMMLSAYPSTPTASLEMLVGIRPIELHLKEVALSTSVRLKRTGHWQSGMTNPAFGWTKSHSDICNTLQRGVEEIQMPMDMGPKEWLPNPKYGLSILDRQKAVASGQLQKDSVIRCYTDGSKMEEGDAGAGVSIWEGDNCTRFNTHLGSLATVFQGEIVAIAMAAEHLLEREIHGQRVVFLIDSQAAIKALGGIRTGSCTTRNCTRVLNLLGEGNEVLLQWVPGHMDVQGNEEADKEAKEGALRHPLGPKPFLPIPEAAVSVAIKMFFEEEHKSAWWADDRYRQTKELVGWAEPWLVKKLMQKDRRTTRLITQVLTGHCSLQRHRFVSKQVGDETCPKCYLEEETPDHHVGVCPYYERERVQTLGGRVTSIRDVLSRKNVGAMVDFLKLTKRLEEF